MTTEYSAREQRGWYLYDWANSPFFTSVLLVFLGPYLTALAKAAADPKGFIHPFGIPVDARSLYPYLISISVAGQVHFSSGGRRDRGLRAPQERIAGADGVSRIGSHGRDVLHPRYELHAGSRAADRFQHQLRRVDRGVQLVPARNRSARAARCDFLARVGAGIRRRRRVARPESSAALACRCAGHLGSHGRAHQPGIGGSLVRGVHDSGVVRLAESRPRASSSARAEPGGGRVPATGAHAAGHAPLSADAAVSGRLPDLQRRHPDRSGGGRPIRQRWLWACRSRN